VSWQNEISQDCIPIPNGIKIIQPIGCARRAVAKRRREERATLGQHSKNIFNPNGVASAARMDLNPFRVDDVLEGHLG